jgi:tetratricopeptide (TPR) repeat protein
MEHYKNLSLEDIVYTDDNGVTCVEQWKDIPDYEGLYQASDLGRIKSLERFIQGNVKRIVAEKILNVSLNSNGYPFIGLNKNNNRKRLRVHRIMAMAFLGLTKDTIGICDHIDNNRQNNKLSNLQIISSRFNNTKDAKNKTNFNGVKKTGKKFSANIKLNGKNLSLGTFDSVLEAHKKYEEAFNLLEKGSDISHLVIIQSGVLKTKGVVFNSNKFVARLSIDGKKMNLGAFCTLEEASDRYKLAIKLKKEKKSILHLVAKKNENKTGYKGVSVSGNKFMAIIRYNNSKKYLGTYNLITEASKKYQEALNLIKEGKSIEHLIITKKPT